mmetsp:Transcript_12527/g.38949  ORF Transcript_12527/g.38949 Transcript_12527/m.38949 type:complete len:292 (+) Transcript_12527:1073-1948(+)
MEGGRRRRHEVRDQGAVQRDGVAVHGLRQAVRRHRAHVLRAARDDAGGTPDGPRRVESLQPAVLQEGEERPELRPPDEQLPLFECRIHRRRLPRRFGRNDPRPADARAEVQVPAVARLDRVHQPFAHPRERRRVVPDEAREGDVGRPKRVERRAEHRVDRAERRHVVKALPAGAGIVEEGPVIRPAPLLLRHGAAVAERRVAPAAELGEQRVDGVVLEPVGAERQRVVRHRAVVPRGRGGVREVHEASGDDAGPVRAARRVPCDDPLGGGRDAFPRREEAVASALRFLERC